jgi:hypothetical protein
MLEQWYNDNPSSQLSGKIYTSRGDDTLNKYQTSEMNLREPIEAYSEIWKTIFDKNGQYVSASPTEGTRRRNDLPPLYLQWKEDYKKRFVDDKTNR